MNEYEITAYKEKFLSFLREKTKLVPALFKDICELYGVSFLVFIIDKKDYCFADDNVNGEVISIDFKPIAIALDNKWFSVHGVGKIFSPFNSKIFTLLHEIMHVVYSEELADFTQNIFNSLGKEIKSRNEKSRTDSLEILALRSDFAKMCRENLIDKLTYSEYRRLRPYIHRNKYEWKNKEKPNLEFMKQNL